MSERLDRVMAYLDGELDAPQRQAFEREMAADSTLAAEVSAHRSLSARLAGAYAPVLDEPVPLRLEGAARTANDAGRGWNDWRRWAAMAACVVVGAVGGRLSLGPPAGPSIGGDIPATAQLARSLDRGLAAEPGAIRIGLTFRNAEGRYCRTFQSRPDAMAGMACRDGDAWRLVTATAWSPGREPMYRTAASETPPEVMAAVDRTLRGETLDAPQEQAARDRGWR
jgi:hypothetical protein